MKKLSLLLLLSVFVFCGCSDDDNTQTDDTQTYVLSLPDYKTHTLDMGDQENPDDSWSISSERGTTDYKYNLLTDASGIFEFDCVSSTYGFYSDSFAFTNCAEEDCPDFANYDYRAITHKGVTNDTYVIVGAAGYKIGKNSDKETAIRFRDNDNPDEPEDYRVKGLYVTNSVYAYYSMKEGKGFYGEEEKFGSNDSFKLTIYNYDKTRQVECYLAEGTDILHQWKWVDLTPLGETVGLKFSLTSTKKNEYGTITPTYFCLDGITIED